MLLLQEQATAFQGSAVSPDWVEERLAKGKTKADELEKSRNRDKNRERRLQQMQTGAQDLKEWLMDLLRQGLATAYDQPESYWESIASRMVDAKLGTIGRRLRQLPLLFGHATWPEDLVEEIGDLFRLTRAWEQMEFLNPEEQWDLWIHSGLNLRREEVTQGGVQPGLWRVWHIQFQEDDQLKSRRLWLREENTGQFAMILDYVWGETGKFEGEWSIGELVQLSLSFYPSAWPLRAVVSPSSAKSKTFKIPNTSGSIESLNHLKVSWTTALGKNPWIRRLPFLFDEGQVSYQEKWFWKDNTGAILPLQADDAGWKLLALGAQGAFTLFGEFDGHVIYPLSVKFGSRILAV